MFRNVKALGASVLFMLLGCRHGEIPTQGSVPETGDVALSIEMARPGVLARAATMTPRMVLLRWSAPGEQTRSDTLLLVVGERVLNHTSSLASGKQWTLSAQGIDQRDSLLYQGAARFQVVAGTTVSLKLSLDPRYSTLRLRVPLRGGARRIQLSVDGEVRRDTALPMASDGDTVTVETDYLSAIASGAGHRIGLRLLGPLRGAEALLYEGDTTLVATSGQDMSAVISLWWVAPLPPPGGHLGFDVGLAKVGSLQVLAGYEGLNGEIRSMIDPRDGAIYRTRDMGGKTWMLANLGSTCTGCDSGGTRFYDSDAQQACPAGWHLPDTGEWHDLVRFSARGSSDSVGISWLKSASRWERWGGGTPVEYVYGSDVWGFHLVSLATHEWTYGNTGYPLFTDRSK